MGEDQTNSEMLKAIKDQLRDMQGEIKRHETRMGAFSDVLMGVRERVEDVENSSSCGGNCFQRNFQEEDRGFKLELPEFDGSSDPEIFVDWVPQVEGLFEYKEYDDAKRCKMAVFKLTKLVLGALWYDNLKSKRRERKDKIEYWEKFKKKMERRWVPR